MVSTPKSPDLLLRSAGPLDCSHQLQSNDAAPLPAFTARGAAMHRQRRSDLGGPSRVAPETPLVISLVILSVQVAVGFDPEAPRPPLVLVALTSSHRARGPVGTSPKTATPLSHIIHKVAMAGSSSNVAGQGGWTEGLPSSGSGDDNRVTRRPIDAPEPVLARAFDPADCRDAAAKPGAP